MLVLGSPVRRMRLAARAVVLLLALVAALSSCACSQSKPATLELSLMATCPFARELLAGLLPVLDALGDDAKLDVTFIGRVEHGEPVALYGEAELAAATRQLCVLDLYGTAVWQKALSCELAKDGSASCAEQAGAAEAPVQACMKERGKRLLLASYARAAVRHLEASPTLLINGKVYDGGRSQAVVAQHVCASYGEARPSYCAALKAPAAVRVTIVGDKRCDRKDCDDTAFLRFLSKNLPGAQVQKLDFSQDEARTIVGKVSGATLPLVVFDRAIEHDAQLFAKLSAHLFRVDDAGGYVFRLGASWDPTRPI